METQKYHAQYIDDFGTEETIILNDGRTLQMRLRGVDFRGSMIDDWKSIKGREHCRSLFTFDEWNQLFAFSLHFQMPVTFVDNQLSKDAMLAVNLEIGKPQPKNLAVTTSLRIALITSDNHFQPDKAYEWFDDGLLAIRNLLPENCYLRCCHSCAHSDYSPAGYGMFGCLTCFKNAKEEYLSLKGKAAFFQLMDRSAGMVQETFLCQEFEFRKPGTGYRG